MYIYRGSWAKFAPFFFAIFFGNVGALPGHARIADHCPTAASFFGGEETA